MNDALQALAAAQHGLLSRQQALKKGMSVEAWNWLTESGEWKREYPGVVRRVGAPQTWEQAEMTGCLAADGIASHRAAGVLHGLPEIGPRLELIIPQRRRTMLKGFEVHTTSFLEPVDRTHRRGIPVTSLARTGIDLSLEIPDLAPTLVDHLVVRKVPLSLLENRLDAMGVKGRKNAGKLVALLEERKGRTRLEDSGLQRRFEEIALDGYMAGLLPEPYFEYPVRLSDGRMKYPDIAYPHIDLGFEAVSHKHHSTVAAFAADIERTIDLFGEGWFIVPVTVIQVRQPVRLVERMARIIVAVEARRRS
jgi:hypothetical protein